MYSHFNPRSREGSDPNLQNIPSHNKISIHAPARGATQFPYYIFSFLKFQSTLPRGERLGVLLFVFLVFVFQSTLPRGERRLCSSLNSLSMIISIHAPARGATTNGCSSLLSFRNFNPRSREGSDLAPCHMR